MRHLLLLHVLFAGFLFSTPLSAQAVLCSLTPTSPDAVMPPDILINFQDATAVVAHAWNDGQRLHEVTVASTGNRRSMGFTLPFSVNTRTAMVHYTLIFFVDRQELRVSANAGSGFDGNFRGVYGCRPVNL